MDYTLNNEATEALVDLETDTVIKPVGCINATITRPVYHVRGVDDWKYLKSGNSIEMPEGSAIFVKSDQGFILAQFYEPGTITGPLVFAKTDIEDATDAYRRSADFRFDIFGSLAGIAVIGASAVMSYVFDTIDESTSLNLALIALMGAASGMFLISMFKGIRAGYYSNALAISKMKQHESDTHKHGLDVKPPVLK